MFMGLLPEVFYVMHIVQHTGIFEAVLDCMILLCAENPIYMFMFNLLQIVLKRTE